MRNQAPTLILTAAALTLVGCRTSDRYAEPEVAVAPQVDEAMVLRDWPLTEAQYAPGDVVAGSVGFLWEVDEDVEEPGNFLLQVPTFIGNLVVLPVTVFLPPPTAEFAYEGVVLPPSYTANPPLPKRTTLPTPPTPTTMPSTRSMQVEPDEVNDLVPTTYPVDDIEEGVVDQVSPAEMDTPTETTEPTETTPRRETAPVAPVTPVEPVTPVAPTTQPVDFEK